MKQVSIDEAPAMSLSLTFCEADARAKEDVGRRWFRFNPKVAIWIEEIQSVLGGFHTKGGADLCRTAEQVGITFGEGSVGAHFLEGFEGLSGADEDGGADSGRLGGDVEHPMHAVREVDVGMSGRAEHDLVARGGASVGMASGIVDSSIGLGFDDLCPLVARHERGAEQGDGSESHILGEGIEEFPAGHVSFWGKCTLNEKRLAKGAKLPYNSRHICTIIFTHRFLDFMCGNGNGAIRSAQLIP